MVETVPYTLDELLRERREGAVRALVRAVGYALARGNSAEDVGYFFFDSYRLGGEFERWLRTGQNPGITYAVRHVMSRWGWCDDVQIQVENGGLVIGSESMLRNHGSVLDFHGVTQMDMEACMETFWRLCGKEMGVDVTYTIGDQRDVAVIRSLGGEPLPVDVAPWPEWTADQLAAQRRIGLATGIVFSIGYAKHKGDEPEDFGHFFYQVWDRSGHYDRLKERWGFANALAYAQNIARSRQVLYRSTDLYEDLDGYTISSPSWATEIPQIMGTFGCLPDDVYRYYLGGGIPACAKLGLQYADQSDDRLHRVWIRSR